MMKKDRKDYHWDGDYKDDFPNKYWKKVKKYVNKHDDIIKAILQDDDNIVYTIDYNIGDDMMREEYYTNLIDSVIYNYKMIIDNDESFDVWVNDSQLTISMGGIRLMVYPHSMETTSDDDRTYEFFTKTNHHKKYFSKFLDIESYKDFKKTSELVNSFISKHKLNRDKDLDTLLEEHYQEK